MVHADDKSRKVEIKSRNVSVAPRAVSSANESCNYIQKLSVRSRFAATADDSRATSSRVKSSVTDSDV